MSQKYSHIATTPAVKSRFEKIGLNQGWNGLVTIEKLVEFWEQNADKINKLKKDKK